MGGAAFLRILELRRPRVAMHRFSNADRVRRQIDCRDEPDSVQSRDGASVRRKCG
jgi:hypothetical protein